VWGWEYLLELADDVSIGIFGGVPEEVVDGVVHELFELDVAGGTSCLRRYSLTSEGGYGEFDIDCNLIEIYERVGPRAPLWRGTPQGGRHAA
jgi:hypothetical protein